ncbi:MAG: cupin domain-containing protein [Chloroflexi bacterium]|nr:cupin domain-containing protein [Chloroflexota bacterium]
MKFSPLEKKGLTRFLIGDTIAPEKLSIHITEVEPGSRSHAAHTHAGVEAFYVFEGQATVEVEGEHYPLNVNESIVVDASVPHGIFNSGATRTRYMVIIAQ